MKKNLLFSNIEVAPRNIPLMLVWFLDKEGNMYDWCPKWVDVEKIFLKAITVERFNKPESEFLNKFAKMAEKVVYNAQRIQSGYRIEGRLQEYHNQQLVIIDVRSN